MIASLDHITFDNPQLSKLISGPPSSRSEQPQTQQLVVPAEVQNYIAAALAENTRRAYRSDLRNFTEWGGSVPCTPEALAAYIAKQAEQLSPVTITRRITAISRAHTTLGLPDPATTDLVRTVLRGVRRAKSRPQRQVAPILRQDLLAMVERVSGVRGARDRALLLLGFAAALRRSEIVSLDVQDIEFVNEGVIVHQRRSKTDQTGEGRKIGVPFGRTGACPVKALRAWLDISKFDAGPLFRSIRKGGQVTQDRLSPNAVASLVKAHALAVGLDPESVSGHSLRAGLVTSAAIAGVPVYRIQRQTGHRSSEMLVRYIRDADLFTNNAGGIL